MLKGMLAVIGTGALFVLGGCGQPVGTFCENGLREHFATGH